MASAADHLAGYGVTLDQAREFLFAHLGDPAFILSIAAAYGVTNEMLGEIAGGYSAAQVQAFFSGHGLDGGVLDARNDFLPDDLAAFSGLVSLNTGTGLLATDSLRVQLTASVGAADYAAAFNPLWYVGGTDGTFTAAELGFSHLGDLPATTETVESLFYGTLANALRAVDVDEEAEVDSIFEFVDINRDSIMAGNVQLFDELVALVAGVVSDPAVNPLLSEIEIAGVIVNAGEFYVPLLVHDDGFMALFDGIVVAFF